MDLGLALFLDLELALFLDLVGLTLFLEMVGVALLALMLTDLIQYCFQVIFVYHFQVIFVRFLVGFIQSGVVYCLVVEWLS